MCAPIIAVGIMAAAAIGGAISSAVAGEKQKTAAQQRARAYEMMAKDAEDRGTLEATRIVSKGGVAAAQATGAYAAAGVKVSEGSAAEIPADVKALALIDAHTRKSNARREAMGLRAQRDVANTEGDLAGMTGWLGFGTALLKGAAGVAGAGFGGGGSAAVAEAGASTGVSLGSLYTPTARVT